MLRRRCLSVTLTAAALLSGAANPPPVSRVASVITTFEAMCFLGPTEFALIDRRATAMRMQLMLDRHPPAANGVEIKNKIWGGTLATGPFGLFLDETTGRKGTATACAVSADVSDVDAFREQVVEELRLPQAPPARVADGERSYVWDHFNGPGNTLIVRDLSPSGRPGAMIKLVALQKR